MAQGPHLRIENLSCERQDRLLFDNINIEASAGELIRINGQNGAGKSTLLKIISGLHKPTRGIVYWNQQNIAELSTHYTNTLSFLGHKSAVKAELTVIENIRHFQAFKQPRTDLMAIRKILSNLSLQEYEDVEAGFLSQGQQRRIALARLWFESTQLWVLDEPYTALDRHAVNLVNGIIVEHLQHGGIAVVTSHQDIHELKSFSKNVWLGT